MPPLLRALALVVLALSCVACPPPDAPAHSADAASADVPSRSSIRVARADSASEVSP